MRLWTERQESKQRPLWSLSRRRVGPRLLQGPVREGVTQSVGREELPLADKYGGRLEQMFPRLSPAQLARLAEIGQRRQVARGEIVAEQGDSRPRFFVVLSGALSIVHPDGNEEVLIQN